MLPGVPGPPRGQDALVLDELPQRTDRPKPCRGYSASSAGRVTGSLRNELSRRNTRYRVVERRFDLGDIVAPRRHRIRPPSTERAAGRSRRRRAAGERLAEGADQGAVVTSTPRASTINSASAFGGEHRVQATRAFWGHSTISGARRVVTLESSPPRADPVHEHASDTFFVGVEKFFG